MARKKVVTTTTTVTEEIINTNEKTHIICILDRSGSMSTIIDDSIGGFNTFLKQQKELPDEATITVALFDDEYKVLYDNVRIKEAKELTKEDWIPRGWTSLYDAIGKSINDAKTAFKKLGSEKPDKVLVCVVTDGQENSSKEYSRDNIKNLIRGCEKENWNFIYLAANQDAFSVGSSFGISGGNTITYTANSGGVFDMSQKLSKATISYRSTSVDSMDFADLSKNLLIDDQNDIKTSGSLNISGCNGTYSSGNVTTTTELK